MSFPIAASALRSSAEYLVTNDKEPADYKVGDTIPLHDYRFKHKTPAVVGYWVRIEPCLVPTLTKPPSDKREMYGCNTANEVVVLDWRIDWVPCFNTESQELQRILNFFASTEYLAFSMPCPDAKNNRKVYFHRQLCRDYYRHRRGAFASFHTPHFHTPLRF